MATPGLYQEYKAMDRNYQGDLEWMATYVHRVWGTHTHIDVTRNLTRFAQIEANNPDEGHAIGKEPAPVTLLACQYCEKVCAARAPANSRDQKSCPEGMEDPIRYWKLYKDTLQSEF